VCSCSRKAVKVIKSLPVGSVKHFHERLFHSVGGSSHSAIKLAVSRFFFDGLAPRAANAEFAQFFLQTLAM
jgi:hypothetical protein